MSAENDDKKRSSPFGPRPEERVFTGGRATPPSVRVRAAAQPGSPRAARGPAGPRRPARAGDPTGRAFEPAAGPQSAALAELARGPGAPKSSLAFEPDEGDLLDRVRDTRLPSDELPRADAAAEPRKTETADAEIGSLIELAANIERDKGAASRRTLTPAPRRADLSGDIEAELFGPRKLLKRKRTPAPKAATARRPAASSAERSGPSRGADGAATESKPGKRARPSTGSGRARREPVERRARRAGSEETRSPDAGDASSKPRGWSSVLVSDAVVGKKRKRPTTHLFRSTRFAEKAIGRGAVRVAGTFRRLDGALRYLRLSLASIFAIGAIAALTVLIGVPLAWTGGILAICLILSLAGQPARNLLGYAGVIIAAAAIAEIVRQRERFLEILKMFLG